MGTDDSPHVCTRFSPAPASILSSRNAFIRDLALIQHRLYQKMESVPIFSGQFLNDGDEESFRKSMKQRRNHFWRMKE
jgi:hypothetical protein